MMRTLHRIGLSCAFATMAQVVIAEEIADARPVSAPVHFDIAVQPLAQALDRFALQSGLQLVYHADEVAPDAYSPVLVGNFAPEAALRTLLAHSGLAYRFINTRTVGLRRAEETRLAVAAGAGAGAGAGAATREEADSGPATTQQPPPGEGTSGATEEIVITGTHIRGTAPVGSQLISIDRAEIERSGYSTVADVVRSLPQNFGGGVTEDYSSGRDGQTNFSGGIALNLRGLGPGSTLVLLNGRRLADSGSEGRFTDISSIPLSAVERIDVLPDSASAIYGSDAVGGVVNIVLRKDYRGAETRLKFGSVTEGTSREYQLGQLFGGGWEGGHALLSYEFRRREPLLARDRRQTASLDLRPLGGSDFRAPFANPGTILDPLTFQPAYAIPRDQDGRSLTPADFTYGTVNYGDVGKDQQFLALEKRHGLSVSLTQDVNEGLSVFFDGLLSDRRTDSRGGGSTGFLVVDDRNPFFVNPTGSTDPIYMYYDFTDDLGPQTAKSTQRTLDATFGTNLQLGARWHAMADLNYAREKAHVLLSGFIDDAALNSALSDSDPSTAFNPFGDGSFTNPATLAGIDRSVPYSALSSLRTAGLTADGPLFGMPGGDVQLAVGINHREQRVRSQLMNALGTTETVNYGRNVTAAFAELRIPLIGEGNHARGLRQLTASLAGRHEKYSDFGTSTNPKLGLEWSPLAGLLVRGSWSTSFKAPNVVDMKETSNISAILALPDPAVPSSTTMALAWIGGNADLRPETSETWSLGVELVPERVPGLNVSLTYFDINFRNRIEPGPFVYSVLGDPTLEALVIDDPTPEQIAAVCSRSNFSGNAADCLNPALFDVIVDVRTSNASKVRNSGLDALASYPVESRIGRITFGLNATYLLEFARALRETSPLLGTLDTPFNPLDFRARASLVWTRQQLETSVYLNYSDAYRDSRSTPGRRLGAWRTVDLNLNYRFPGDRRAALAGASASLNVQNLFDSSPPFLDTPGGYDAANADLLGRLASLTLRKEW